MTYYVVIIPSPLGDLIAIADETHLLMLEFADSKRIEMRLKELNLSFPSFGMQGRIQKHGSFVITQDDETNEILTQTQKELSEYFSGKRKTFTIPLAPSGTEFQKNAWEALTKIPYGETRSYKEEAILAGNPKAVRAIGGANNKNPIPIIIPCHRVIGANGDLVGYGGGIERKTWLLEHEKKQKKSP